VHQMPLVRKIDPPRAEPVGADTHYVSRFSFHWGLVYLALGCTMLVFGGLCIDAFYEFYPEQLSDPVARIAMPFMLFAETAATALAIKVSFIGISWQLPRTFVFSFNNEAVVFAAKSVKYRLPRREIESVYLAKSLNINMENWFGRRKFAPSPAIVFVRSSNCLPTEVAFPIYSMPLKPKEFLAEVNNWLNQSERSNGGV